MEKLRIRKNDPNAVLPTRAHPEDAGLDLYSLEDKWIAPSEGSMISTGISLEIPPGHVGMVADRSSLAKKGVKSAGGVIDAGYRGIVHVVLWNISKQEIQIRAGDRIAQMLILPIRLLEPLEVVDLEVSDRGDKGFGSSGR